jgi:F-type H+-transporting ATPase subunit delta
MESVASRYANALYSLALENNAILAYQKDMKIVKDSIINDDFLTVLDSDFLTKSRRIEIIDKVFEDKIDKNITIFLKLIVKNDRVLNLEKICNEFNSLCNKYLGIEEGIIYSTYKLSDNEIKKVEQTISKKEGKKIELKNKINPELLGGIKVIVHDHIYDGSILAKLDSLRKNLLR